MARTLCALVALATSCGAVAGVSAGLDRPSAPEPVVIGSDSPVFLGQMTVTATALPDRR